MLELEMESLKRAFEPSNEALEYLERLNKTYSNKTIKFYYSDPMLVYFIIDDPDCADIPIYEEVCQGILASH